MANNGGDKDEVGNGVCLEITIALEPVEEGGFAVSVPSLPGCYSYGKTKEEALQNAKEAITLFLEPVGEELKNLKPGSVLEKITL